MALSRSPSMDAFTPENTYDVDASLRSMRRRSVSRRDSYSFDSADPVRVCVIGGGVAGSTVAIALCEASRLYMEHAGAEKPLFHTTVVEAGPSMVNGPPFCHLHAGGNLYREIPDEHCVELLRQCVDVCRLFPHVVERRPSVILVPVTDTMKSPEELLPRLALLRETYEDLIAERGASFAVLGDPKDYYKLYSRQDMQRLRDRAPGDGELSFHDRFMLPVAKSIDSLESYQYPVIMVAEDGWNMFRQAATCTIALEDFAARGNGDSASLKVGTRVVGIRHVPSTRPGHEFVWEVTTQKHVDEKGPAEPHGRRETGRFDFLVNAAGHQTGTIDDLVLAALRESGSPGAPEAQQGPNHWPVPNRMVEFKSSYMTQWDGALAKAGRGDSGPKWPEVIVHGIRGTPQGMAQLTPYAGGHFQLHGMTKDITLFENGLVKSTAQSAQPELADSFNKKLDKSEQLQLTAWREEETCARTQAAIDYMGKFLPSFGEEAMILKVTPKQGAHRQVAVNPFCGGQQIPGNDPNLRAVAGVSFLSRHGKDGVLEVVDTYCRAEIVKASSAPCCAEHVVRCLQATLEVDLAKKLDVALKDGGRDGGRCLTASSSKHPRPLSYITEQQVIERAKDICRMRHYPECLAEPYHDVTSDEMNIVAVVALGI